MRPLHKSFAESFRAFWRISIFSNSLTFCKLSSFEKIEIRRKTIENLQQSTYATVSTCEKALEWLEGRKNVVMVPLSFTSDHIETLFEIEKLYLPILSSKGLNAFRCPALNREAYWIEALYEIAAKKISAPTGCWCAVKLRIHPHSQKNPIIRLEKFRKTLRHFLTDWSFAIFHFGNVILLNAEGFRELNLRNFLLVATPTQHYSRFRKFTDFLCGNQENQTGYAGFDRFFSCPSCFSLCTCTVKNFIMQFPCHSLGQSDVDPALRILNVKYFLI